MMTRAQTATRLVTRILLAVPGAYVTSASLVAATALALSAVGLARSEAVALGTMLGFIFYLVLLLWAFVERRLWRLAAGLALLGGGGFILTSLASV